MRVIVMGVVCLVVGVGCADESANDAVEAGVTVADTGVDAASPQPDAAAAEPSDGAADVENVGDVADGDADDAVDAAPSFLRPVLPPDVFAVAGLGLQIIHQDTILTENPSLLAFSWATPLAGTTAIDRWASTPTATDVGAHPLTLSVRQGGTLVAKDDTNVRVARADAGAGKTVRLLLVGDSLTAASIYPNALAARLSVAGNPTWKMLGTQNTDAAIGVAHEGHPGWSWKTFATAYDTAKAVVSPFLFPDADGKPELDVGRYFDEQLGGARPDHVIVLLGTNDCFGANPDDAAAVDACADAMLGYADAVLSSLRAAAPDADIGLATPPTGNERQSAFEANYGSKYTRWGWRRIQHRLVERYLAHFGGREAERLFVIPTHLVVDPVGGYPETNAVHPNAVGYGSIADAMYGWLKWRLSP